MPPGGPLIAVRVQSIAPIVRGNPKQKKRKKKKGVLRSLYKVLRILKIDQFIVKNTRNCIDLFDLSNA